VPPNDKQLSFGGLKPTVASTGPKKVSAGSSAFKQVQQRCRAITKEIEEIAREAIGGKFEQTELVAPEEKPRPKMAAVMWGAKVSEWVCDYQCRPVQLTRGLTHKFDCPYWANEGKEQTPIDKMKPPE
jgi:hypothetical protein